MWIRDVDLCDFRVKARVSLGGHNIPTETIRRRYQKGLVNFYQFYNYVDDCQVYLAEEQPKLILRKEFPGKDNIFDLDLYTRHK